MHHVETIILQCPAYRRQCFVGICLIVDGIESRDEIERTVVPKIGRIAYFELEIGQPTFYSLRSTELQALF